MRDDAMTDDEIRAELERIAAEKGGGTTADDVTAEALREFIARHPPRLISPAYPAFPLRHLPRPENTQHPAASRKKKPPAFPRPRVTGTGNHDRHTTRARRPVTYTGRAGHATPSKPPRVRGASRAATAPRRPSARGTAPGPPIRPGGTASTPPPVPWRARSP